MTTDLHVGAAAIRESFVPLEVITAQGVIDRAFNTLQHGTEPLEKVAVLRALIDLGNHHLAVSPAEERLPSAVKILALLTRQVDDTQVDATITIIKTFISKILAEKSFFVTALTQHAVHDLGQRLKKSTGHSSLHPSANPNSSIADRTLGYPVAGPFDYFLANRWRKEEPTFPTTGILFNDLQSTRMGAVSISQPNDPRTNELLSTFFGRLIDEGTFLQIFGMVLGAHQVHACELTRYEDLSVRMTLTLYANGTERESGRFVATIPAAPAELSSPWVVSIDEATSFMKRSKLSLGIFIGWAALLRTALHVDNVVIPNAYGDAPLWAEKAGFIIPEAQRNEMMARIKEDLTTQINRSLDDENSDLPILLLKVRDAQSLEDLVAITGRKSPFGEEVFFGREAVARFFKSEINAVSTSMSLRRNSMAHDPFPRLVSRAFGRDFMPLEIFQLLQDEDTKTTAEAFLKHHDHNIIEIMQSDEALAQAIVERMNNWAVQALPVLTSNGHGPQAENLLYLRHITNMLFVIANNAALVDAVLKILVTRGNADQDSFHDLIKLILKAPDFKLVVVEPFLMWAKQHDDRIRSS